MMRRAIERKDFQNIAGHDPVESILLVIDVLSPYGAQRVCKDIAIGLDKDITVYLLTYGAGTERIDFAGRRVVRLMAGSGSEPRLFRLYRAIRMIRRYGRLPGSLGVISFMPLANIVTSAALMWTRTCRVLTEHNVSYSFLDQRRGRAAWKAVMRKIYSGRHTKVVAVSETVSRDVRAAYKLKQRPVVIYNPIDVAAIGLLSQLEPKAGRPFDPSAVVILVVAKLKPAKGHDFALRALAHLPDEYMMMFVGDGPLRPYLEDLARDLGIRSRVAFLGVQPNPYPYMMMADLVAVTSSFEGFGLVIAEAAALGRPLAVRSADGSTEIAQRLGVTVLADTPQAFRNIILDGGCKTDESGRRWLLTRDIHSVALEYESVLRTKKEAW